MFSAKHRKPETAVKLDYGVYDCRISIPQLQPCPNTMKEENENKTSKKWKWTGWTGVSLVIFGYYLNANLYDSSWLVWMIGNILVGIYSIKNESYSIALMSFVIAIINLYGYISWLNA